MTVSVRGIVQLGNEIWFLIIKYQQMMVTGVAEGYRHIRGGPFSPGLPHDALFTQILRNQFISSLRIE